ncbi:Protein SUPPRESSOR OF GENE SILENCING 3 [Rhynchospora pubera]|uniref:Protein SUPPRESSOR OF GENE SILENCING 3 n=1 Tax=Rhynchospora pubera TaxID=906938 RepID=A0AAV8FQN1_9POAL|nr:Protein SUPPRESSOR OF GENE SILENCING 3 [Rhynchospora pubera]
MNSQRGSGSRADISNKGKAVANMDPINCDVSSLVIENQDDGWEVISKKNRNRSGPASAPPPVPAPVRQPGPYSTPNQPKWGGNGSGRGRNGSGSGFVNLNPKSGVNLVPNSGPNPSPWPVTPDPRKPVSRVNPRPQPVPPQQPMPPPSNPGVQPPLVGGRNWADRVRLSGSQPNVEVVPRPPESDQESSNGTDDDDDDCDMADDSDDDLSDDYDSDASQKSHGTRKQNNWFKSFFDELDRLNVNEINEQTRQWHCPACAKGPGAIDWYKGLQPLMTHAKTKGATRVKLHRELANLLEEELRRRGTSVIPVGEQYGKWQGLRQTTTDHEIVWPPMVVIMNTYLDTDENDKNIGMGNQELLEYFSSYAAKKARHSYGPRGHRGFSLLIFEADAVGYMEAERLHRHFEQQGTDRHGWDCKTKSRFLPGGKRQLFGYLACKEDLEDFNRHCQGKSRLKYDLRSYQEMVVEPMRQMNEDNQLLYRLRKEVVKQKQCTKVVEQTFGAVSKRLRDKAKENDLVREKSRKHHEETKEELDNLEKFFQEQIEKVHEATEEKEKNFHNQLQEERSKAAQSEVEYGSTEDRERRKQEIDSFIANLDKGVDEFEAEKNMLMELHKEKKKQRMKEYMAKEMEEEMQLDASLTKLMDKYRQSTLLASSSNE